MINVTETAARRIRMLMAKQGITTAGCASASRRRCSGMSYVFAWEREARPATRSSRGRGREIFVDKKSLPLPEGHDARYDTSLMSKGFVFQNPNAKTSSAAGPRFNRVARRGSLLRLAAAGGRRATPRSHAMRP